MKPYKHAELIKAWADGAEIQQQMTDGSWIDEETPTWWRGSFYRIKPEPKIDVVRYLVLNYPHKDKWFESEDEFRHDCIKIVRDGETGKLKSAEVLK